ncbi:MAG: type III pantothenate kinase [Bacteroidia bacterium]
MALAFDFGNTSIKIGIWLSDTLLPSNVFTFLHNQKSEFASFVKKQNQSTNVIISSVAGHNTNYNLVLSYFENTTILNYQVKLPFAINYDTPETLGKDRIAACAAATIMYAHRPLLVIDAGTCITYDFINETNTYIGGAISPGIVTKLKAMHQFTQKLPFAQINTDYQPFTPQKSTKTCLLEGAYAGTIHEIRGFIATFGMHKSLKVVFTGGFGEYLADKVENSTFAAPNLVLVGLQQIRKLNAG